MNDQTTTCPYCYEEIKAEAKKCKHCGEYLIQEHASNHKPIKPGPLDSILGTAPLVTCSNCKKTAKAKLAVGGSLAIEIVLWLTFLIPGLIYHLWRNSTMRYCCAACGFQGVREVEEKANDEGPLHRLTHHERSKIVQPAIIGLVISYFFIYDKFVLALPLVILLIAATIIIYKLRIKEKQKNFIMGFVLVVYAIFVLFMLFQR